MNPTSKLAVSCNVIFCALINGFCGKERPWRRPPEIAYEYDRESAAGPRKHELESAAKAAACTWAPHYLLK